MLLTLLGALAGAWLWRRRRPPLGEGGDGLVALSLGALVLLLGTSLLPDPSHEQYFTSPLLPLLVPAMAAGFATGARRRPRLQAGLAVAVAAVVAIYALVGQRAEEPRDPVWALAAVEKVARGIERHSAPDDTVLAFWPGYAFESGRRGFPGLENQFGVGLNLLLTREQRARYHIAGPDQIFRAFTTDRPRLLVIGGWMGEITHVMSNEAKQRLTDAMVTNFELVEDWGEVGIMARRTPQGR